MKSKDTQMLVEAYNQVASPNKTTDSGSGMKQIKSLAELLKFKSVIFVDNGDYPGCVESSRVMSTSEFLKEFIDDIIEANDGEVGGEEAFQLWLEASGDGQSTYFVLGYK